MSPQKLCCTKTPNQVSGSVTVVLSSVTHMLEVSSILITLLKPEVCKFEAIWPH